MRAAKVAGLDHPVVGAVIALGARTLGAQGQTRQGEQDRGHHRDHHHGGGEEHRQNRANGHRGCGGERAAHSRQTAKGRTVLPCEFANHGFLKGAAC